MECGHCLIYTRGVFDFYAPHQPSEPVEPAEPLSHAIKGRQRPEGLTLNTISLNQYDKGEHPMSQDSLFHATTILAVKKDGHTAVAGDGQVTMGNAVIMKNTARKVRRLYHGRVIAGFAGSVADAFALFDKFEARLSDCNGNLVRAAVEFAKEWRRDRVLQKLEALLIMTDGEHLFLVSGNGEVIEPDDGILAIGSGGNYALAAARALVSATDLSARDIAERSLHIAADICVYTNHNVIVEEI